MKKWTTQAEIFETLITPHIPALYKTAYRLTGGKEASEDLVQAVLTKLYPQTADMQTVEMLGPWLKKVLYRHFIDETRKHSRRPESRLSGSEDDLSALKSPDANPEKMAELSEIRENLHAALNTLEKHDRLIIVMHLAEGYTLAEMAEIFNMPSETLKTKLRRAKVKVKKYLKL